MKDYVCERVINMAKHISATKCTLREAAKVFSVGKSTAHKDMTERLQFVDKVCLTKLPPYLPTTCRCDTCAAVKPPNADSAASSILFTIFGGKSALIAIKRTNKHILTAQSG